jgi:hypothetical protein
MLDGNPNVCRQLRSDLVKRERGKKTDHPMRYRLRGDDQRVMFGDRAVCQSILTAGDALDQTLCQEPRDLLAVNPRGASLFSGKGRPPLREGQQTSTSDRQHV